MDNYEAFKKSIYKLTGIDLSCYKEKQMKRRIKSLMSRNSFNNFNNYYIGLKKNEELFKEFLNYLTINVSEFYRNPKQWEILEKNILPNIIKNNRKIKVWSSACSTGEEPYSLVMLLTKFFNISNINVLATDLDKTAISKAQIGVYNEKSLKNLPMSFKKKFFKKVGNSYRIDEKVKKCVEFKQINLLKDSYPKNYHLILCRNVMIYFTEDAKLDMYRKFHDSLTDDGVFFVGSTEQIILPSRYNLKPIQTFFYKK